MYDAVYDGTHDAKGGQMSGTKKSKDDKKIRVTIGFSGSLLKRIDARAKLEGKQRGPLVRRAVTRYLDVEDLKQAG